MLTVVLERSVNGWQIKRVIVRGVDITRQAIADAKENAKLNGINEYVLCGRKKRNKLYQSG